MACLQDACKGLTSPSGSDLFPPAQAKRTPRDSTSAVLAEHYGITMKAVRDIWNLRTWTSATMPYWTSADHSRYLRKHLCKSCQRNGVKSFAAACNACSKPRRRGRPALVRPAALGSADAMSQGDSDSAEEAFTCADAWAVHEAGQAGDLPPRDVADQREALPGWLDLQETDDGRVHFTAHRMYACNRDPRIQESCYSLPTFRQPQAIAGVMGFQRDGDGEGGEEDSECDLSFLSCPTMQQEQQDDWHFFNEFSPFVATAPACTPTTTFCTRPRLRWLSE